MRSFTSSIVVALCLAFLPFGQAQDFTIVPGDDLPAVQYNKETANNTSACFAYQNPSYCTGPLPNLQTTGANQAAGAETIVVDAFPEHISTISLKRLMYSGWNGKLICEYQPWFGLPSHTPIGYDESNSATVNGQDSAMISRGCNINLISFYGTTIKTGDPVFELGVTTNVFNELGNRGPNYPLQFAVLEIADAFKSECKNESEADTITCIENALKADMDYISANYANNPNHTGLYWADHGTNVIGYFGACGDFSSLSCPGDWETIWSTVQNYVNSPPQNYNFEFVFESTFNSPADAFVTPSVSAGAYAWPQPFTNQTCISNKNCFVSNPPSQHYWCDPNGVVCNGNSNGYLDTFYSNGYSSGKLTIGLLYSGFDDSNASWTLDRVIAQQCGHVMFDTANEVTAGGLWGKTHQLPYTMMATWNDYEEGTEQESGVDNCYTAVNTSLSGSMMN